MINNSQNVSKDCAMHSQHAEICMLALKQQTLDFFVY